MDLLALVGRGCERPYSCGFLISTVRIAPCACIAEKIMGDAALKENPMDALPPEETIRSAIDRSVSRLRLQHEIAVQFATSVLRVHSANALLDEACKAVSAGLRSRFAKVLRYQPESETFVLEAGVGWDPPDIGTTELGADDASPAGHAFPSGRPVLSNHLGTEHRFRTPDLLPRHGI